MAEFTGVEVRRAAQEYAVRKEEHRIWYGQTLRASDRELFVIILQGQPAGAARYDFDMSGQAEIRTFILLSHIPAIVFRDRSARAELAGNVCEKTIAHNSSNGSER